MTAPLLAARDHLVKLATRVLGRGPKEVQLRCLPVRRRLDGGASEELAEWRATFAADGREWAATGDDREGALEALEEVVGREAEKARKPAR